MSRIALLLLQCFLAACANQSAMKGTGASQAPCLTGTERERLLALDQHAFDQDLSGGGGGWRAIAAKNGCEIAAANLIRDYRERHSLKELMLYFHEGQMRARGNDYAAAIALFEISRMPNEQDLAGWNYYVDASIAFLRKDKEALIKARDGLAAVKAPPEMPLKDGVFEIPNNSGRPFKMRWPPNIDTVNGLINCFEQSYREASDDARCRPAAPM